MSGTATPRASARWLRLRADAGTRAAVHMSIDGLADINARHGRAIGDWVLGITGARLHAAAPDHALVVRQSGDDFVVLIDDADDSDLAHIIDHFRRALEPPIGEITMQISFGLATARPGNGGDDLIETARRATRLEQQLRLAQ